MRHMLGRTAAAVVLLTTAACARSGAEVHVPAQDVASQIVASVSADLGVTPQATCPQDLPGRVGATLACTLVLGESTATALVTVTEVSRDDEVRFDIRVDGVIDTPAGTPTDTPTGEGPTGEPGGDEGGDTEVPREGPTLPGTPLLPDPPIPIPSVDQPA